MTDRMITPPFTPVVEDSAGYTRQLNPDIPFPSNIRDLSPDMLSVLGSMLNVLRALYNDSARPRTILLEPGTIFTTHVRFKLHSIIVSGAAGDRLDVKIGTDRVLPIYNVSGNPVSLPISMFVDRGVDISVVDTTNPSSTLWAAALLASEAD
jgi:hypothetical protein